MQIQEGFMASSVSSDIVEIAIIDISGKIIHASEPFARLLGYHDAEELLGRAATDFSPSSKETNRVIQELLSRGTWLGELTIKSKNGAPLFAELSVRIVKNQQGNMLCATVSLVSLLTSRERQNSRQALIENTRFTANLVNHSLHPIMVLNPDTSIRTVNRALETLTGYSSQELIGAKSPYPWLTAESLPRTQKDFTVLMNCNKVSFEERYRKKNGEAFWVRVSSIPVRHQGELEYCITIWVDITETKNIEKALRNEIDRAQSYLDIAGVIIASLDDQGNITMVNRATNLKLGFETKELVGRKWVNTAVAPPSRTDISNIIKSLLLGNTDQISESEGCLLTKDGRERCFSFNYVPVKDSAEKIIGVLISGEDINDTKKNREQLGHAQLLLSLQEMTARIAHEVNNPLGSILLYSELLLAGEASPQLKKDLKIIHDEAKRAVNMMTNLLNYGRRTKTQLRRISLHRLLDEVIGIGKNQLQMKNISLTRQFGGEALFVQGDSRQLVQAFMNIILYVEETLKDTRHGEVTIITKQEKPWAKVIISDNGPGIPEEKIDRIFYPFFNPDATEETGLHLSVSYGIITDHKGLLRVENNAHGGSSFIIELPLNKNKQAIDASPKGKAKSRKRLSDDV
ncbi:MAG: PAS domain S-box protein [Dehalococcoidales bacterium]|nr:PAS domain S-box protein [Dehalococcoidales bacterium]